MVMDALDGVKELGRLGHRFCGHLHMERYGVLVGVDLDAGQLGAVLVYVLLEVDDTGFVLLDELTHLLAIVLETFYPSPILAASCQDAPRARLEV